MTLSETDHFVNRGFGWVCRKCELEDTPKSEGKARILTEGEAEAKSPELSTAALARWASAERNELVCPRCGTREKIKDR